MASESTLVSHDVMSSYGKSLKLWIGRHREAMATIRDMEKEILDLHRTLCAVVHQAGGEVVLPQKLFAEIPPILATWDSLEDGSVHLAVRDE